MRRIRKRIMALTLVAILVVQPLLPERVNAKVSDKEVQHFTNLVLFAHFMDNAEEDAAFFANQSNRDKIISIYNGSSNRSVKNYLSSISYGKFDIQNIFPQDTGIGINSYALPYTKDQAVNGNIDYSIIHEIITHIPEISNQVLDYDGDGCIDNVTVIVRGGNGTEVPNTTMVCHKSDYPSNEEWSGKSIGTYNILNTYSFLEQKYASEAGVVCHEFLHSLGYPDLYNSTDNPVYIWDIMASVNYGMTYPLAYMRSYFSGWLDIDTIKTSQTLTLDTQFNADGNQAYILQSPLSEQEVFVVEFRKKGTGNDDLERYIGDSGVIVYRIDKTVTGLSNYHGKTGVYVFRPQEGQTGYSSLDTDSVYHAALSPESGRTEIGSSDLSKTLKDGALTFSDGTNSGIVISDVSSNTKEQVTLKVTIPESSQFDMWKDLGFDSSEVKSEFSDIRDTGLVVSEGVVYLAAYQNGKLQTYRLENGSWVAMGTGISVSYFYSMRFIESQGKLYLAYNSDVSLYVKSWNGTTWTDVVSIPEYAGSDFDLTAMNGKVYLTYINSAQTAACLDEIDAKGIRTQVGGYTPTQTYSLGQPKLAVFDNKIYQVVREYGKLQINYYDGMNFVAKETKDLGANTFDVESHEGKLYLVVTDSSSTISLLCYDGKQWTSSRMDGDWFEPQLAVAQGNLYALTAPSSGEGKLVVYRYDTEAGTFEKEGEDVDHAAGNLSFAATDSELYVAYKRTSDQKILTKNKTTAVTLKSLTITPPSKTTYRLNDSLDTTGMKVVANYTKGSREIADGYYTITGFDTSKVGEYLATVTYEGVSNTFSYEVLGEAEPSVATYTIKYNGNGATGGTTASSSHTYDVAKNLTSNGYERKYTVTYQANGGSCNSASAMATGKFNGWAVSADGAVAYTDKQSVKNLSTTDKATVNLYANWTLGSVTLPTPTRTGYTFQGWNTSQSATSGVTGSYTPSGNVTLYAIWKANDYKITYAKGTTDTTAAVPSSTACVYDQNVTLSSQGNLKGTGYKVEFDSMGGSSTAALSGNLDFAGWKIGTSIYQAGKAITNPNFTATKNGTVTATAQWNSKTLSLPTPTRSGYSFAGWYTESSYQNKVTGLTVAPNVQMYSKKLYAKWIADTYTISYTLNGGTQKNPKTTYAKESDSFTLVNPTRTGYTFTGWTGSNGTTPQTSVTVAKGSEGNRSYSANWKANTYMVAYNGNGATGGTTASSSHTYDVAKNLTANGYERKYTVTYQANGGSCNSASTTATGTFNGWAVKADGAVAYTDKQSVKNLSATNQATVNLYAKWTLGSVSLPTPTRTGYTFMGWGTSQSAASGMTGSYTPSGNVTLYAIWKANAYTVAYNGNGATGGTTASSSHSYDVAKNLTANGYERKYTVTYQANGGTCSSASAVATGKFNGWAVKADGAVTYTDKQSVKNLSATNQATVNLYAKWTLGSVSLLTPTRTGYTFLGWNTSKSAASGVTGNYTPTGNVTLYAIWREKTSVVYQTHVQDYGWQNSVKNGEISGTSGQSKRLEGIKISLSSAEYSGDIEYRTHIQDYGWESNWKKNGEMSGTSGQAKRLEAIQIRLTGDLAAHYDIYYRVHAQNFGWMDWAKNGAYAGTAGYAYRLEAIQIVLVEKGQSAPGSVTTPYRHPMVKYQTHVQDYGWQKMVQDGQISGTSGQSKRLEGIKISLSNAEYSGNIEYRTHIQNYGWEKSWKKNGEMSGTSGQAKRLEAIQIQLTGDMAVHYDVYYRVHAQNFGWMDWAKNGASAGTAGYAYRLEAIQIMLIPKDGQAPGNTDISFRQKGVK